jgi:hypothetical protein
MRVVAVCGAVECPLAVGAVVVHQSLLNFVARRRRSVDDCEQHGGDEQNLNNENDYGSAAAFGE